MATRNFHTRLVVMLTGLILTLTSCLPSTTPNPSVFVEETTTLQPPAVTPLPPTETVTLQALPLNINLEDEFGIIYFQDIKAEQIRYLPARCLIADMPCPSPQAIPGFDNPGSPVPLTWSPGGQKAAIIVGPGPESDSLAQLQIFDPQTGLWKTLTSGNYGNEIAWSFDEGWLAFASATVEDENFVSRSELFLIRPDGNDLHVIAPEVQGVKSSFVWLDETTVAFVNDYDENPSDEIHIIDIYRFNIVTGELQNLTASLDFDSVGVLETIPNGSIAFTVLSDPTQMSLFLMSLNTLTYQAIIPIWSPLYWSPNREWILMEGPTDPQNPAETPFFLTKADGTEQHQILTGSSFENVIWSPDSQYALAKVDTHERGLWLISISGEVKQINLSNIGIEGDFQALSWQPPIQK